MAGHKPHIRLIKGSQPPVWVCKGQGRWNGHGGSPQDAYRDWGGRSIDLGRYAGTHGGARPDQAMAAHAAWWMFAWTDWDACKRFIVGGLVAAAVLWLLWR